MNIFKRLFSRRKSKTKKAECWYNDHPAKERCEFFPGPELEAQVSPNSVEYSTAQQIHKTQL